MQRWIKDIPIIQSAEVLDAEKLISLWSDETADINTQSDECIDYVFKLLQ